MKIENEKIEKWFRLNWPKFEFDIDSLKNKSLDEIYKTEAQKIAHYYSPTLQLNEIELNCYSFQNTKSEGEIKQLNIIFYSDSIGLFFKI